MTSGKASFFRKYFVPGLVFQGVLIGGGYGTGRELVEYFMKYGPLGGILGMFLVMAVFNILGEEFFWRGVMLPKMNGVFGKWDGVANGVIGGAYHLSQPWQILGGGIFMWTVFMLFRSSTSAARGSLSSSTARST